MAGWLAGWLAINDSQVDLAKFGYHIFKK